MDRKTLIDYLDYVCDAENAIYTCDQGIDELRNKIQTIENQPIQEGDMLYGRDGVRESVPPAAPEKKMMESEDSFIKRNLTKAKGLRFFDALILGGIIAGAIVFTLLMSTGSEFFFSLVGFFLFGLMGAIPCGLICYAISLHFASNKDHQRIVELRNEYATIQHKIQEDNNKMTAEYQQRLQQYNIKYEMKKETIAQLKSCIGDLSNKRLQIVKKLETIYAANIIHPNFRNMLAVNTIRDYLQMGLCEELEGTNGAYAEYMKDVRANRIIDSVDELQSAIVKGLNNIGMMQAKLMQELRSSNAYTESMIHSIETTITSGFNQLHSDAVATDNTIRQSNRIINSAFREANSTLSSIHRTLETSAYNQYIAQRAAGLDRYDATMFSSGASSIHISHP